MLSIFIFLSSTCATAEGGVLLVWEECYWLGRNVIGLEGVLLVSDEC